MRSLGCWVWIKPPYVANRSLKFENGRWVRVCTHFSMQMYAVADVFPSLGTQKIKLDLHSIQMQTINTETLSFFFKPWEKSFSFVRNLNYPKCSAIQMNTNNKQQYNALFFYNFYSLKAKNTIITFVKMIP